MVNLFSQRGVWKDGAGREIKNVEIYGYKQGLYCEYSKLCVDRISMTLSD